MSTSFDFTGKKVLVTGASQGIGRALAIALSKAGAKVFALARNRAALESLQAETPNTITAIVCDLTEGAEAITAALHKHQPFHALVNNAGIAVLEDFLDLTEDAFERSPTHQSPHLLYRTVAVNLRAPLFVAQAVAHEMIKHDINGSIVHVSSQASQVPIDKHLVYCSTKAALDMACRVMARELGPKGIRVNCVNPTVVMTDMGRANWSDPLKASVLLNRMPVKRFAELEDVTHAVLFLLSDASAMTTGHSLPVDGGYINQ